MSINDRNRNPNWDWTINQPDTLYPITLGEVIVDKPYFDNTTSAFTYMYNGYTYPDIKPEDGWVLLLRDFGDPDGEIGTPYFILYNKYRGILRFFIFGSSDNIPQSGLDYVSARLYMSNSDANASFFTLTDSVESYTNSVHSISEQSIDQLFQKDQWNFFDFYIGGDYPNLSATYDKFEIQLNAYQSFNFNATASLDVNGYIGTDQGGTTHANYVVDGLQTGVKLYESISKGFKDVQVAKTNYDSLLSFANRNKGKWWEPYLQSIGQLGAQDWIPALGPLVGALNFITGGGSSSNFASYLPLPVSLSGNLVFNGTLNSQTAVTQPITFIVPGASVQDSSFSASVNELTFYHGPVGNFNLQQPVYVTADANSTCLDSPTISPNSIGPGGGCQSFDGEITYHMQITPVFNTTIFSSEDIYAVFPDKSNPSNSNLIQVSYGEADYTKHFSDETYYNEAIDANNWENESNFPFAGLKVILHPRNSGIEPVTILHKYTPDFGTLTIH